MQSLCACGSPYNICMQGYSHRPLTEETGVTAPYIETQEKAGNMGGRCGVDQLFQASSGQVGAGPPPRALWPFLPQQARHDSVPVRFSKDQSLSG